jgi:hypothetical protein
MISLADFPRKKFYDKKPPGQALKNKKAPPETAAPSFVTSAFNQASCASSVISNAPKALLTGPSFLALVASS